jgi:hypothetical protein
MRTSAGVKEFLIINCVGVKTSDADDETERGEEWRLPTPDCCSSDGTSKERTGTNGHAQ